MRKRTYISITIAIVALAAAGAFFLFSRGGVDAYATAIPQNSSAIACLDVKALVREADLSVSDEMGLLRRYFHTTDEAGTAGLDLTRPVFAFVSEEGNVGLVARVKDAAALKRQCELWQSERITSPPTEQRGLTWSVVSDSWLMAFDSERLLVLGPAFGSAQDALRTQMAALMQQSREESALVTELYALASRTAAPLAAALRGSALASRLKPEQRKMFSDEAWEESAIALEAHTRDNIVTLDAEVESSNEQVKARLAELGEMLRPIDAALVGQSHKNTALWLCANLEGTKALELLRGLPAVRVALLGLNTIADVDAILRSIDGDVALDIPDGALIAQFLGSKVPPLMLTAETRSSEAFAQSDYWLQSSMSAPYRLQATSPTDFAYLSADMSVNFGTHDNVLYINTLPLLGTTADGHPASEYIVGRKDDIRGTRLFATVDLAPTTALLRTMGLTLPVPQTASLERLEMTMREAGHIQLRLSVPEGTNIARQTIIGEE